MRNNQRFSAALLLVVSLTVGSRSSAQIPREEYVEALNRNGFALLAIDYLRMQLNRPGISKQERADLEFQIASAMITASTELPDLSKRETMLEDSRTKFAEYLKKYPDQPLLHKGQARVHVATIDLQQGRLRTVQAQLPSNLKQSEGLAKEARKFLRKSVEDYEKAYRDLFAQYDQMPKTFVQDAKIRQQKTEIFEQYIEARFQASLARFYLADTFHSIPLPEPEPKESNAIKAGYQQKLKQWDQSYKKILAEALHGPKKDGEDSSKNKKIPGGGFEGIHLDHRQEAVGQFGYLWSARCMAAQGEHNKAMGIFEHIMAHENQAFRPFQRQVFYFMLLSYAARNEWDLIILQGEEWSKDRENRQFLRTSVGLGVQLEIAKAKFEKAQKSEGKREREGLLRDADDLCEAIVRFPNQYKELAQSLQLKVKRTLGLDPEKGAKSFYRLSALASAKLDELSPRMDPLGRRKILREAKDLYQRALAAAGPDDLRESINEINDARISLAFTYLQDDDVYEAAILSEFIAREYPSAGVASQAAFYGVTAYAWGYENAQKIQREDAKIFSNPQVDVEHIHSLAEWAFLKWPGSKAASDIHNTLARVAYVRKEYQEAAKHFDQVTTKTEEYHDALSLAGATYWDWYKTVANSSEPNAEQMKKLRQNAQSRFAKASGPLKEARAGRFDRRLFVNETMLGEIYFESGQDPKVLTTLAPLRKLIRENTGKNSKKTLPEEIEPGLRIRVLTTMLQSYIRQNDFEEGDKLVELIGRQKESGADSGVTVVLINLAVQMEQQIQRYEAEGRKKELEEFQKAFEKFLDRIASRKEGQTVQSLVFIGNSFSKLKKYQKAIQSFGRAIAHEQAKNPQAKNHVTQARLLMARSNRFLGKHNEAINQINTLLKENMNLRDVILERGEILDAAGPGAQEAAIAHWSWVVKRFERNKEKEYYFSLYRLVKDYIASNRLPKAKTYLKHTLVLDLHQARLQQNPELRQWETKYKQLLKEIEEL